MGGIPDYLFSEIPSLNLVNEWIGRLNIRQGHVFSEEGFNWTIFDQILLEIEVYYYPCKAKKYLYREHTMATALTVLRQLVKPHGLTFRTHERLIHRKKYYEYYLVPDLSTLPDKPESNQINFD
jgi:hypothetical protein